MRENQSSFHTLISKSIQEHNYDESLNPGDLSQSELLETLERVVNKTAPGPAPSFNVAQVVKALEIIAHYRIVGRVNLSNKLGLGMSTTRTILKHLKKEGLIVSSRNGFEFSEQGKKLFLNLRSKVSGGIEVPNSPLTVGPLAIAVLVRNMAHKVGRGVEQRNTAIRAGASGATKLIFSRHMFIMPSKKKHNIKGSAVIADIILSKLNPKENDVVIIGSGDNRTIAEIGAIMAALKLSKSGNEIDE